ncbi:DUF1579 domain-containing protein [Pseudoduganella violaceinigra]|uniref:DUF1579 domain-containing protein n=1 Tax=Pseudoduganella violaceinigra TaxID=246602 RepID=UPI0003F99364|nr:DUF1579 domain-containing protein [Pseudoduganella violaceinigra]
MKLRRIAQYLVVVSGFTLAGTALSAAPEKKKAAAPPDEKAAMEAMTKASTPGEAHKKLEALAGKFTVKSKMWMDPSKPPEESDGATERKWIMGNRYLEENYQGKFMGQAFDGLGIQGYDNVTKKYFGSWIDSGSTSMTLAHGTMNGNTIKYKGMMSEPMMGKEVPYTMNIVIADNDNHKLEMWGPGPNGKEMKWMEMSYTRVK